MIVTSDVLEQFQWEPSMTMDFGRKEARPIDFDLYYFFGLEIMSSVLRVWWPHVRTYLGKLWFGN